MKETSNIKSFAKRGNQSFDSLTSWKWVHGF